MQVGKRALKVLLTGALIAAVLAEGYYIFLLNGKIEEREEELKKISVQIQTLKNERDTLHGELSAIKKSMEARRDGNTSERGH